LLGFGGNSMERSAFRRNNYIKEIFFMIAMTIAILYVAKMPVEDAIAKEDAFNSAMVENWKGK
jgi:hypothetical protein